MGATDRRELSPRITAIQKELTKLGVMVEALAHDEVQAGDRSGLESTALRVRKFYASCERILILMHSASGVKFARRLDWRSRLLKKSAAAIAGVRPPIISPATRRQLQQILTFRNLERNIYGYTLQSEAIVELSRLAQSLYPQFVSEIERSKVFLPQRPPCDKSAVTANSTSPSAGGLGLVLPNA